MLIIKNRLNKLHTFRLGLIILLVLAWTGAGLAVDSAALPAKDWNPRQVERLQAPAGGKLTFAVLGDSRSNPPVFERVLKDMAGDPSLTFAIDIGDMVERGTLEQFDEFFKQIQPYSRMPFLTAAGNHDLGKNQDLTLYREIFGPDYYAFQLKDHYFIVLNNNLRTGMGEAQMAWLEDELKKSQSYKTRLVFFHYPLFDPRGEKYHHSLPEEAGRRLAALFSRYKVTYIFASHIHGYFTGKWDGVPFTVSGGGGAPLAGADPAHFFYHYLKVTLQAGEVHVEVQRIKTEGDK
ncbi:MAG: metallophosphoesterase [Proteobacteria bacterium]|nr:metallophosphoesterase [Pseudomonadota bacterium]MBU4357401.1 metallophosphoesterase [Pseudomonadota bacterium]MBU4447079.1 metallophosphoesterase [Pseudomonadota bacterium]